MSTFRVRNFFSGDPFILGILGILDSPGIPFRLGMLDSPGIPPMLGILGTPGILDIPRFLPMSPMLEKDGKSLLGKSRVVMSQMEGK